MRLDLNSLAVQSFATSPTMGVAVPADTGKGGPDSYCYICYETGNTVPSCAVACEPVLTDPETHFEPCTHQLTCRTCV